MENPSTIEKIIKVVESHAALNLALRRDWQARGRADLAERYFGEWLEDKFVLDMLKDPAKADEYYEIWRREVEE